MIEGYLYQRILQHLDNPLARKYAIASVILPELSPELVFRVLIPVVEPGKAGHHAYARQVFEALQNVGWLVVRTGNGYLRLREELRSTMLKILSDTNAGCQPYSKLRRSAMAFHLKQDTPWDKAMHLYHQLILSADKQGRVSKQILAGVNSSAEYLIDFVEDLPRQVGSLLSRNADEAINPFEAINILDDSEWQRLMEGDGQKTGKGQYLVDKVDAAQALQLYRQRPTTPWATPPTFVLQAMCDAAQWDDSELSVRNLVDDFIYKLEPGPKVWRETLLRLQWFTRLILFRQGAGLANELTFELSRVLGSILERCSLYGVTTQLADTFATAEAMYGHLFFRKDIFERRLERTNRSSDDLRARSPRLSTWRNRASGGDRNPLVLPWESCVARPDVMSLLEKHYGPFLGKSIAQLEFLAEGPPGAYPFLNGKPWVEFQRYIRSLNDYHPPNDSDGTLMSKLIYSLPVPVGLWPEFYRPLRQIWIDDLCRSGLKLNSLGSIFNQIVPVIPKELSEDNFTGTVYREPRIWFFVIAQHADRSGKLLELLDVMIEQNLYSGLRLIHARNALRVWQRCFWKDNGWT